MITGFLIRKEGQAPEGTAIHVSFPKQIIGADGHIWRAEADSPQEFLLYQAGRHKYYVEYRQGEKIAAPEDPDREGREGSPGGSSGRGRQTALLRTGRGGRRWRSFDGRE